MDTSVRMQTWPSFPRTADLKAKFVTKFAKIGDWTNGQMEIWTNEQMDGCNIDRGSHDLGGSLVKCAVVDD